MDLFDLMLDENNDLQIVGGDVVVGEVTAQNQRMLLLNGKGDYKEQPLAGVGIATFIDDDALGSPEREIAKVFMADGMEVANLTVDNSALIAGGIKKIYPNAYYKTQL